MFSFFLEVRSFGVSLGSVNRSVLAVREDLHGSEKIQKCVLIGRSIQTKMRAYNGKHNNLHGEFHS